MSCAAADVFSRICTAHALAHLAITVQRCLHARLQVVQRNWLQDIEVVGHLILDWTGTVEDVLQEIHPLMSLTNESWWFIHVTKAQKWGLLPELELSLTQLHEDENVPYGCTVGDCSYSWMQTFPGKKETRNEVNTVTVLLRCTDTFVTWGGDIVSLTDGGRDES